MKSSIRLSFIVAATTWLVACGGAEPSAADPALAEPEATGREAPAPPTLSAVEPMAGGLHVTWKSVGSCDAVHAERKADMEGMTSYEHAFRAQGEADNKMDADASHDAKYTYRLRCERGGKYSAYSNERSANPKN